MIRLRHIRTATKQQRRSTMGVQSTGRSTPSVADGGEFRHIWTALECIEQDIRRIRAALSGMDICTRCGGRGLYSHPEKGVSVCECRGTGWEQARGMKEEN